MSDMTLTLESPTDASVVLDGVDWQTYVRLSDSDRAGVRITYDQGRMEIMPPPSMGHGKRTFLLARLVERYLEVAAVEYVGGGRHHAAARGVAARVRGRPDVFRPRVRPAPGGGAVGTRRSTRRRTW